MLVPQVTCWTTVILELNNLTENKDVNLVQKITYILRQTNNLDSTFELMPVLSGTVICIAKFVSTIQNPELAVLQHMRDDWNNLLTKEETHILTRYAEKSRKITLAYSTCVIGFTLCYSFLPLTASILDIISPLNETRPKKFPQLMDFVIVDQEKHYYALLMLIYLDNFVLLSIVVGTDTLYILLVEHICGMYSILCYRLENLKIHDKWIDNDCTYEEANRCIRDCIQLHKEILLLV
ncbi:uncharacterized protein [Cardiocondyla obscurior]|uniref:uncharacterized protein n=1 Tax=Cardiocondyla obscurior TaxID=286306 RepID=UPI00396563C6